MRAKIWEAWNEIYFPFLCEKMKDADLLYRLDAIIQTSVKECPHNSHLWATFVETRDNGKEQWFECSGPIKNDEVFCAKCGVIAS